MHSTSNHRRRMELFRDRHRIVQDLLVKKADASREVSKIAEDSRTIVDRIALMGVDHPKYGKWLTSLEDEVPPGGTILEIAIGACIAEPNFKKLSGDLRGLNDEVNGVTRTQFSELRKHILDSVHDEEMRKKIENDFLGLSNKFRRYCKLYEAMKSSDTPRPKGDLKMGKH
ncbi:hypothetical protein PRIPAC_96474 [Pristionchus pacificus]|uniref:Uncharacterized protein n=1 Tax=Pristionchus pacificus TaxID=54126 RepID=A0A2A6D1W3_PRIPA|nr:hypothetical protein PRIPAC_96474 [Pristionchus pacificus]|eukprot:PDM84291.1 hypothetical protein PRIPAC_33314 [Pristionchus pacificus]